ncbi:hypothetical protein BASA62_003056 [Batrachochytrium salamandrivorans]|nr:hypothetical protein BASA62_003056 [Batrachochytrium salamandrivorans]
MKSPSIAMSDLPGAATIMMVAVAALLLLLPLFFFCYCCYCYGSASDSATTASALPSSYAGQSTLPSSHSSTPARSTLTSKDCLSSFSSGVGTQTLLVVAKTRGTSYRPIGPIAELPSGPQTSTDLSRPP